MAPPREFTVGPQWIDDGNVTVQTHYDQQHGREVEAEGAEESKHLASHVASKPKTEQAPSNLEKQKSLGELFALKTDYPTNETESRQ